MNSKPKENPVPPGLPAPLLRTLSSADLFADGREVAILHEGTLYRLSITRQGKLILTK